jgi:hypothetical protein
VILRQVDDRVEQYRNITALSGEATPSSSILSQQAGRNYSPYSFDCKTEMFHVKLI